METGFTGSLTIWLLLPKIFFIKETDKIIDGEFAIQMQGQQKRRS